MKNIVIYALLLSTLAGCGKQAATDNLDRTPDSPRPEASQTGDFPSAPPFIAQ